MSRDLQHVIIGDEMSPQINDFFKQFFNKILKV